MSEAALQARSLQRRWARRGSSYDRVIALLRLVLPLGIAGLFLLLAIAPVIGQRDISFVLSKDRVATAHEYLRVADAVYRGQDQKGEAFRLNAGSAVQQSSRIPIIRLAALTGDIALPDGPTTIRANTGRYDTDTQKVMIDGAVQLRGAGGYQLDTRDVTLDMMTRKVESGGAVDGAMTLGTFRANRLDADLATKVITLTGAVHLRIVQSGAKAAR